MRQYRSSRAERKKKQDRLWKTFGLLLLSSLEIHILPASSFAPHPPLLTIHLKKNGFQSLANTGTHLKIWWPRVKSETLSLGRGLSEKIEVEKTRQNIPLSNICKKITRCIRRSHYHEVHDARAWAWRRLCHCSESIPRPPKNYSFVQSFPVAYPSCP